MVYTGLIDLLEDDTLLSAVLAHEIRSDSQMTQVAISNIFSDVSHVVQRHAVENVSIEVGSVSAMPNPLYFI